MRPRHLALLLCVLGGAPLGCGGGRCDQETDADKRDWCYYESAIKLHNGAQFDAITGALGHIQSSFVRALAVQKILASSPDQFTQQQAESLCNSLDSQQANNCFKNWSRPHLWTTN